MTVQLQKSLVTLYEILYHGTVCAVRDPEDDDDLYYDEFDNTFSDGREIRPQIRVEPPEESDSIAQQFSDMPYREVRRALRYKVRDFARQYGVEPEVILQAIKCSDVTQFVRK